MTALDSSRPSLRVRSLRSFLCAAVFLLLLRCGPAEAVDAESKSGEYEVKAAFLLSFARFVKWPPQKLSEADSPFVIGLAGEDPFGSVLDKVIHGKKLYNHKLVVRRFSSGDDLRKCDLLFIGRTSEARLPAILGDLHNEAILTVGESDKFIGHGGMINFLIVSDTVRFEINPAAAEKAGLKVDSRLLRLAIVAENGRARAEH